MKLYRIFLPKKYNNKTKIPWKIILGIAEQIEKRFGGYSMNPFAYLPIIDGSWTEEENLNYKEQMFLLEVFVEDTFKNKAWIKAYKEIIKQDLDQKEIFIIEMNAETV